MLPRRTPGEPPEVVFSTYQYMHMNTQSVRLMRLFFPLVSVVPAGLDGYAILNDGQQKMFKGNARNIFCAKHARMFFACVETDLKKLKNCSHCSRRRKVRHATNTRGVAKAQPRPQLVVTKTKIHGKNVRQRNISLLILSPGMYVLAYYVQNHMYMTLYRDFIPRS